MNELALFAGAGGGILGGLLLGWRTVCAVEIDAYCRSVLLARQRDRVLEPFPIWDDVRTFDGKPWRGRVDVISGGFPCQDISRAGRRSPRAGIEGERSGLWGEFARIIGEVRPLYAFLENSPDLTFHGLGTVLGDLATLGFDARWDVLGAHHVGAPHKRDRIWVVCVDADRQRKQPSQRYIRRAQPSKLPAFSAAPGWPSGGTHNQLDAEPISGVGQGAWWGVPHFAGVDDGVASRLERVRATGNGQVPAVVRLAWETLAP